MKKRNKEKIIVLGHQAKVIGGLENFVFDSSMILKQNGYEVSGFFTGTEHVKAYEKPFANFFISSKHIHPLNEWAKTFEDLSRDGAKVILVHDTSNTGLLSYLQILFKLIFFVHDHSYYCSRQHKYYPFQKIISKRVLPHPDIFDFPSCTKPAKKKSIVKPHQKSPIQSIKTNFLNFTEDLVKSKGEENTAKQKRLKQLFFREGTAHFCNRRYQPIFCGVCSRLSRNPSTKPKLLKFLQTNQCIVFSKFMRQNLIANGVGPSSIHLLPALIHQKFLSPNDSLANNSTEKKAANKQRGTHKGKQGGKQGEKQGRKHAKKSTIGDRSIYSKAPHQQPVKKIKILYSGQLVFGKGVDNLLIAIKILKDFFDYQQAHLDPSGEHYHPKADL